MADFSPSEMQGLALSLVTTPMAVLVAGFGVHTLIPGDTGITIASVVCAAVFLAVPRIAAGLLARPVRTPGRRLTAA